MVAGALSRRAGLLAVLAVAVAQALMIQPLGWNQTAHMALVKSLADGRAEIDRYHWETGDKAYTDGHFYAAKAPGLALLALPSYLALDLAGADGAAADAAQSRDVPGWRLEARRAAESGADGGAPARTDRVARTIEEQTPLAWALGLFCVLLPSLGLLLTVRWAGGRLVPGYGTAAAVALGLGTLVLPFSTMLFSHVPAAALGFAAFAVLLRERDGPPALVLVAGAGVLAGLAVVVEYPLALLAALLAAYAAARGPRLRRAAAFAGGTLAGGLPLAAFNLWAFGSLTHLSYDDVVAVPGRTGHDRLGLNEEGVFGVALPSPRTAVDLLLTPKGALILMPVLAAGAIGALLLWRRGRRAEAALVAVVALVYLVYNAGYYLPFGGDGPGPRFLIPALPFLALGLAEALRRLPGPGVALALVSACVMAMATVAQPLLPGDDTAAWPALIGDGHFQATLFTAAGAGTGWGAIAPFLLCVAAAAVLAARATPGLRLDRRGLALGALAVAAWALVAVTTPRALSDAQHVADAGLVLPAAGTALAGLGVLGSLRPARSRRAAQSRS